MKYALFILGFTLIACATTDEVASSTAPSDQPIQQDVILPPGGGVEQKSRPMSEADIKLIEGTVHVSDEGCPLYIDVIEGDLFFKAYPVNLPTQFQREGLKIKFAYSVSRAPQPEGCTVDKTISVVNTERI